MNSGRFGRLVVALLSAAPALFLIAIFAVPRTASAKPPLLRSTYALPLFARKYGLSCSACHEAWPKLNNFGQVFRDNGYLLLNERDTPITRDASYFPVTVRITPQWHRETNNRAAVDSVPGDATSGLTESRVTTSGFDLSGMDLWFGGALYNNISMLVLPSADATGAFHFESAWIRFDDLLGSRWLNLKFGKHELDTLLSERRFLTLSNVGGLYYNYHFQPVSDFNSFSGTGQGNNQLGVELMGHSRNSYTRYAVSLLSSNNGQVGLPTNRTYDMYANFNQGFEIPGLGLQRIGVFGYEGRSPTYYLTNNGLAIPGSGRGNKSFYRAGAYGLWYAGKFDFSTYYMHGLDSAFLGTGTPATQFLPDGARAPTWNGGFTEVHYTYNPQLVLIGRYELVRMDRQALPTNPGNLGDLDAWTVGYRWYPTMFSRAGLAFDMEYSRLRQVGTSPVLGRDLQQSSFFMGWDFAF